MCVCLMYSLTRNASCLFVFLGYRALLFLPLPIPSPAPSLLLLSILLFHKLFPIPPIAYQSSVPLLNPLAPIPSPPLPHTPSLTDIPRIYYLYFPSSVLLIPLLSIRIPTLPPAIL